MSDNWLRIVPADPNYQPPESATQSACAFLRLQLPDSDEIEVSYYDQVQFIDAGANWEGVRCPQCGEDVEEWWSQAMEGFVENRARDLACELPCCRISSTLNQLHYPWPVAFAQFVLEAMNPNVSEIQPQHAKQIESMLSTKVQFIWQHI